jgi:hypothetical protein
MAFVDLTYSKRPADRGYSDAEYGSDVEGGVFNPNGLMYFD